MKVKLNGRQITNNQHRQGNPATFLLNMEPDASTKLLTVDLRQVKMKKYRLTRTGGNTVFAQWPVDINVFSIFTLLSFPTMDSNVS